MFGFDPVSIVLICLLTAGFLALLASSLLGNKHANKAWHKRTRLAYNDQGRVTLDKADTETISLKLDSSRFVAGTSRVPPTHMNRHQRRYANKMLKRKAKTVALASLIVVCTLTASALGAGAAHLMGGGSMYAEPCHSLLWCN